jgi:hypothetical protein
VALDTPGLAVLALIAVAAAKQLGSLAEDVSLGMGHEQLVMQRLGQGAGVLQRAH